MLEILIVEERPDAQGIGEVLVRGELDFTKAQALQAQCLEALAKSPLALLLDLTDITFLDCAGARMLLWIHVHAWLRSCRVGLITGRNHPVERTLSILGWDSLLPLYRSRADAMRALRPESYVGALPPCWPQCPRGPRPAGQR